MEAEDKVSLEEERELPMHNPYSGCETLYEEEAVCSSEALLSEQLCAQSSHDEVHEETHCISTESENISEEQKEITYNIEEIDENGEEEGSPLQPDSSLEISSGENEPVQSGALVSTIDKESEESGFKLKNVTEELLGNRDLVESNPPEPRIMTRSRSKKPGETEVLPTRTLRSSKRDHKKSTALKQDELLISLSSEDMCTPLLESKVEVGLSVCNTTSELNTFGYDVELGVDKVQDNDCQLPNDAEKECQLPNGAEKECQLQNSVKEIVSDFSVGNQISNDFGFGGSDVTEGLSESDRALVLSHSNDFASSINELKEQSKDLDDEHCSSGKLITLDTVEEIEKEPECKDEGNAMKECDNAPLAFGIHSQDESMELLIERDDDVRVDLEPQESNDKKEDKHVEQDDLDIDIYKYFVNYDVATSPGKGFDNEELQESSSPYNSESSEFENFTIAEDVGLVNDKLCNAKEDGTHDNSVVISQNDDIIKGETIEPENPVLNKVQDSISEGMEEIFGVHLGLVDSKKDTLEIVEATEDFSNLVEKNASVSAEEATKHVIELADENTSELVEEGIEEMPELVNEDTMELVEESTSELVEEGIEEVPELVNEDTMELVEESTSELVAEATEHINEMGDEGTFEFTGEGTEHITELVEKRTSESVEETIEAISELDEEITSDLVAEATECSNEMGDEGTFEFTGEGTEHITELDEERTSQSVEETIEAITELDEEITSDLVAEATECSNEIGDEGTFEFTGEGTEHITELDEERTSESVEEAITELDEEITSDLVAEATECSNEIGDEGTFEFTGEGTEHITELDEERTSESVEEAITELDEEITSDLVAEATECSNEIGDEGTFEFTGEGTEHITELDEERTSESVEETIEAITELDEEITSDLVAEATEHINEMGDEGTFEFTGEGTEHITELDEGRTSESVEETIEAITELDEEITSDLVAEATEHINEMGDEGTFEFTGEGTEHITELDEGRTSESVEETIEAITELDEEITSDLVAEATEHINEMGDEGTFEFTGEGTEHITELVEKRTSESVEETIEAITELDEEITSDLVAEATECSNEVIDEGSFELVGEASEPISKLVEERAEECVECRGELLENDTLEIVKETKEGNSELGIKVPRGHCDTEEIMKQSKGSPLAFIEEDTRGNSELVEGTGVASELLGVTESVIERFSGDTSELIGTENDEGIINIEICKAKSMPKSLENVSMEATDRLLEAVSDEDMELSEGENVAVLSDSKGLSQDVVVLTIDPGEDEFCNLDDEVQKSSPSDIIGDSMDTDALFEKRGADSGYGAFKRIIIIGDAYVKYLSSNWPSKSKIKPYFISIRNFNISQFHSGLKDHAYLSKCAGKIMVVAFVGLHDLFPLKEVKCDRGREAHPPLLIPTKSFGSVATSEFIRKLSSEFYEAKMKLESCHDHVVITYSFIPLIDLYKISKRIIMKRKNDFHLCTCSSFTEKLEAKLMYIEAKNIVASMNQQIFSKKLTQLPGGKFLHFTPIDIDHNGNNWLPVGSDAIVYNSVKLENCMHQAFYGKRSDCIIAAGEEISQKKVGKKKKKNMTIYLIGDTWLEPIFNMWPEGSINRPYFYFDQNLNLKSLKRLILSLTLTDSDSLIITTIGVHNFLENKSLYSCFMHAPLCYPVPIPALKDNPEKFAESLEKTIEEMEGDICIRRNRMKILYMTCYPILFESLYNHLIDVHLKETKHGSNENIEKVIRKESMPFRDNIKICLNHVNNFLIRKNLEKHLYTCDIYSLLNHLMKDNHFMYPIYIPDKTPSSMVTVKLSLLIKQYTDNLNNLYIKDHLSLENANYDESLVDEPCKDYETTAEHSMTITIASEGSEIDKIKKKSEKHKGKNEDRNERRNSEKRKHSEDDVKKHSQKYSEEYGSEHEKRKQSEKMDSSLQKNNEKITESETHRIAGRFVKKFDTESDICPPGEENVRKRGRFSNDRNDSRKISVKRESLGSRRGRWFQGRGKGHSMRGQKHDLREELGGYSKYYSSRRSRSRSKSNSYDRRRKFHGRSRWSRSPTRSDRSPHPSGSEQKHKSTTQELTENERDAIKELWKIHVKECEAYRANPAVHPDYDRVQRMWMDVMRNQGYDPYFASQQPAWFSYWEKKMEIIMHDTWEQKKAQCLKLLQVAKKSKSSPKTNRRSSPRKSSSSYHHSSSSSSEERRKKHNRRSRKKKNRSTKRSRSESSEHEAKPQATLSVAPPTATLSVVHPIATSTADLESRISEFMKKTETILLNKEKNPTPTSILDEDKLQVKLFDVTTLLSQLSNKLGALGVSVRVFHQSIFEAVSNNKNPLECIDEDSKILLNLVADKLKRLFDDPNSSVVQQAIIQEALDRLLPFIKEFEQLKKPFYGLDINAIAKITEGSSSREIVLCIKNALSLSNVSGVSHEELLKIYLAIVDIQSKSSFSTVSAPVQSSRKLTASSTLPAVTGQAIFPSASSSSGPSKPFLLSEKYSKIKQNFMALPMREKIKKFAQFHSLPFQEKNFLVDHLEDLEKLDKELAASLRKMISQSKYK